MGSGSRSAHQTHHVDTGMSTGTTATATPLPPAARVEHLTPTSTAIRALSYVHPDAGQPSHLDVGWHSSDITYRFSGVPVEVWERLQRAVAQGDSLGRLVGREVRGRYDSTRIRADEATPAHQAVTPAGGARLRCRTCGQFVSPSGGHECPVDNALRRHYATETSDFVIPDVAQLLQHCDFDGGQVHIPVVGASGLRVRGERPQLYGEVVVPGPREEFDPAAASRALHCSCGEPSCPHARDIATDIVGRIRTPPVNAADRRAASAVLAQLDREHQASLAQQASAQAEQHRGNPMSYSDNPSAFDAAYTAARQRIADGEPAVPYQLENATGGLGARDGGRAFGVELEFDLPGTDSRSAALRAIGRELHAAGLSTTPYMSEYHTSADEGYSEDRNAWRLEEDCTVAGEIVSPILYDTPQTWQDLQTVCDIIRRHGGQATVRAGGHVHVSAGDYDHTVANHNRLLQMVDSQTDTLFRLATNPERGRHRGVNWCSPNVVPSQGYRTIGSVRADSGHGRALNLQAMYGDRSDHVEFRMWDASLDPGVIQTQIKLSLGMTEAAFRDAHSDTMPNGGRRDRLGHHHRRFGSTTAQATEAHESTRSVRSLLDAIFTRNEDKNQAASLFAATRWQQR